MRSFLALAAVSLAAAPAAADVLLLHDGRVLERPNMKVTDETIEVAFENGAIEVPRSMVADIILDNAPAFEPKTPEEKEKAAKGLVLYDGKWMKRGVAMEKRAKRIEERKARIQEIRDHAKWRNRWRSSTKHFDFEYTVPPNIYEYYADLMEAYYDLFKKTWRIKQPKKLGKLKVCFHSSRSKFEQVGGAPQGALGYFRFIEPLELNFYYNRVNAEQTEQVMYHEVNHYLQKLMNPSFSMPHWPSESICEYYGSGKFDHATKTLTIGHILEGRLAEVKMDITAGKMLGLEEMVKTEKMYEHYNWGWTLVHFLMQDPKLGKAFEKFVKKLVFDKKLKRTRIFNNKLETVPQPIVWEEFKKAMKLKTDDDVKAFEESWHNFVKAEMHVTSSRGLEDAARHAHREGLYIKSKRLYGEAIEGGSKSAAVYLAYAKLLRRDGEDRKSHEYLQKAVELAPLEGAYYAAWGMAMRLDGEKEEGARLLKLAVELEPDNPDLAFTIKRFLEREKE